MSEIDDIKRRAGIKEAFGGGTDPVESIVQAVLSGIDGPTVVDSMVAASGGDPKKAIAITLQVVDRLISFPGAVQKFTSAVGNADKPGGFEDSIARGLASGAVKIGI